MKSFLIFATITFSLMSFGKPKFVCESCAQALSLERVITNSQIVPDPLNAKTLAKQDEFIGKSAEIIKELLKKRPFEKEHARALLKLLSRVSCFYDNNGDIPGLNKDLFLAIYGLRKNVLKSELALMIKSGEITEKRSKAMLESIGAIEAADYIPAGCADYK